jgi:hypothetical protein
MPGEGATSSPFRLPASEYRLLHYQRTGKDKDMRSVFTKGVALAALATLAASAQAQPFTGLEYLGQATFPGNNPLTVGGTTVGGLSGIRYDAANNNYLILSDDRAQFGPARYYTANLNITGGTFGNSDVTFTGVNTLSGVGGAAFALNTIDFEGIAFDANNLYVSDEGNGLPPATTPFSPGPITPSIFRFDRTTGQQTGRFFAPSRYAPTAANGIYHNLAFESLTFFENGASLLTGTENALRQDAGNVANPSLTSQLVRLSKIDVATGTYGPEFAYRTDAIAVPPTGNNFAVTGLVELLSLGGQDFLAVERSFTVGAPGTGYNIKLFQFTLTGATDVSGTDPFTGNVPTVQKNLLFDLGTLGIPLDNIEGVTLGPTLADGRRTLVLVSDDNFGAGQFTQFVVFASSNAPEPAPLALLALAGVVGGVVLRRRK